MKPTLSKEEKERISKLCKNNPYKAMNIAERIFKDLQMKTINEFAELTTVSKRTIYNHIKNPEFSRYEFSLFCNDKYIPLVLNKELLR